MSTTISTPFPATETRPTALPSMSTVFSALLRADLTTQWRNRRSSLMVFLIPVIILISWKGLIERVGGAFALSNCITVGLTAIGLLGYANSVARDRDKGIFQRLRVAPASNWAIMASRLTVQLIMIAIMTIVTFIVGYKVDNISLPFSYYVLGFFAALISGAVYLSLGQLVVGLIRNPETVNATSRLIYIVFIMIGMFAQFGALDKLGKIIGKITQYSPYGVVKTIVSGGLAPTTWTTDTTMALIATLSYTAVFTFLGVRWFRWSTR
ncbi:MAG TPA: ABC transporter permease [Puia sp.]|nr:ABC transporter permease [Puia sp.]